MLLPFPIRNRLFSLGFQVKDQCLVEVPAVSVTDVGTILLLGWEKSRRFLDTFQAYRQNLKDKKWSCLTSIYPRSYYVLYYYLLFWWAEYCNTLDRLIEDPDRSLIAELFFRYIIEIDRLVDIPVQGPVLIGAPYLIKRNSLIATVLNDFFTHLSDLNLQPQEIRQICHRIWRYRAECLSACQNVLLKPDTCLEDVLSFKQKTSGGLFREWSGLLTRLYQNQYSTEIAENSGNVLYEACMAMQVLEDLLDLPADYRAAIPNIMVEILKTQPKEFALFEDYLRQYRWSHMDGIWARENLPRSFQVAMSLVDQHLTAAMKISLQPSRTADLCYLVSRGQSHPIGV